MQKAIMAGVPMVCAISAPSSYAVQLAREFGVTLVGFLRQDRFNIYHAPERIALSALVVSASEPANSASLSAD
jgi:FdhD protein